MQSELPVSYAHKLRLTGETKGAHSPQSKYIYLRKLEVLWRPFTESMASLLADSPYLEEVSVETRRIDPLFFEALPKCPNLEGLRLENVDMKSIMEQLLPVLRECSNLSSLCLSNNNLTSLAEFGPVIYNNTTLRSLDFSHNSISPKSLPELAAGLAQLTNLTALNMEAVATNSIMLSRLDNLFAKLPHLTYLNLSRNFIRDACQLAKMLKQCHALVDLRLDELDHSKSADLMELIQVFPTLPNLHRLDFNGNKIGLLDPFCDYLAQCTRMEVLHLRDNAIGDTYLKTLTGALPVSLTELNLQKNRGDDEGIIALLTSLPIRLTNLSSLAMGYNKTSPTGE